MRFRGVIVRLEGVCSQMLSEIAFMAAAVSYCLLCLVTSSNPEEDLLKINPETRKCGSGQ